MFLLDTLINNVPGHWLVLGAITAIGLSILFIRGLIRLVIRAFIVGLVGFILLGAAYLAMNWLNISL
ncbi:MAG: hypothetical protein KIT46_11095 [Anaerolineales bacterium]|nr:hypothetical protein [Anaerolineales bacterium]MCW5856580.1 hypothetical protein [Anaerolineales bacterium]